MSRVIKFRAWRKDAQRMVGSNLTIDFGSEGVEPKAWYEGKVAPLSAIVLMQFTGLTDKNGKEIYEGDVLEGDGDRYTVVFRDGAFWFQYDENNRFTYDYAMQTGSWGTPKVIGNIYENPELIASKV